MLRGQPLEVTHCPCLWGLVTPPPACHIMYTRQTPAHPDSSLLLSLAPLTLLSFMCAQPGHRLYLFLSLPRSPIHANLNPRPILFGFMKLHFWLDASRLSYHLPHPRLPRLIRAAN